MLCKAMNERERSGYWHPTGLTDNKIERPFNRLRWRYNYIKEIEDKIVIDEHGLSPASLSTTLIQLLSVFVDWMNVCIRSWCIWRGESTMKVAAWRLHSNKRVSCVGTS